MTSKKGRQQDPLELHSAMHSAHLVNPNVANHATMEYFIKNMKIEYKTCRSGMFYYFSVALTAGHRVQIQLEQFGHTPLPT
jgi:hypothetical protein